MVKSLLVIALVSLLLPATVSGRQIADLSYKPAVQHPAFPRGRGPVVLIDEAHHNFHTATDRYRPFADLLRRDGYVVRPLRTPFGRASLHDGKILVIANALAERNLYDWSLPTPSAFSDAEISAVKEWVRDGGALLLIVDHMPFPGAAEKLAQAFGVHLSNGFAMDREGDSGHIIFRRAGRRLADHAITRGRSAAERIDAVTTFTGSAFRCSAGMEPLLTFDPGAVSLQPSKAWQFSSDTPRISIDGWCQGAALKFGSGRVAIFGEAVMFTAQLSHTDSRPVGMNAPEARQNKQFALNVFHWLSGLLN